MSDVVKLKTIKARADESLVQALLGLVECAKVGEIDRMVCVCVGDDTRFYRVVHCPEDLSLIGALSVVLDDLKASCWRTSSCQSID